MVLVVFENVYRILCSSHPKLIDCDMCLNEHSRTDIGSKVLYNVFLYKLWVTSNWANPLEIV